MRCVQQVDNQDENPSTYRKADFMPEFFSGLPKS